MSPVGQSRLFSTPSASSGATVPMSTLTQSIISVCLACINEFISDCEAPINSFHQCEWVSSPCATLGAALLVGIAAEIVADIAEITMTQFRPFLMQVDSSFDTYSHNIHLTCYIFDRFYILCFHYP